MRLAERPPVTKGRKCGLKLARGAGLEVRPSDDFEAFMRLEAEADKMEQRLIQYALRLQLGACEKLCWS